ERAAEGVARGGLCGARRSRRLRPHAARARAERDVPAAASLCGEMERTERMKQLRRRYGQIRAVDLHDAYAAAGRRIGTGDATDGVVDPHRAGTVDDRLLQREDAADQRSGAAVEKGIAFARPTA